MSNVDINFEDELTLKDLILKIQSFIKEIISKWWIVGLFCAVFVGYFVYGHSKSEVTYSAKLKYVVEGQSGSSGGGLSSLLGTFGIKKGGKLSPYKIIEVTKSTKLLRDILKSELQSGGNVANRIIDIYDLKEAWTTDELSFSDYEYDSMKEDPRDNIMIKNLSSFLWGGKDAEGKIAFGFDENNGVYTISPTFTDEFLGIEVSNIIYDLVKNFFEKEIFENQLQSATILKEKADSLKVLLDSKIMQRASYMEKNRNSFSETSKARGLIMNQEVQALSVTYGEVLKNYEMTDVNLKDIQPLFIELEKPFSPLMPNTSSLLKSIITGLMVGGFLSVLFIVFRKIYKDVMR